MSHETALMRALAGGPMTVEDRRHLEECPECRAELAALRATEKAVRACAPRPSADTVRERILADTLVERTGGRGPSSGFIRGVGRLAACALLTAALAAAWAAATVSSRSSAGSALSNTAYDRSYEVALLGGEAISTSSLLEEAQSWTEEYTGASQVDVQEILDPLQGGGTDG